MFNDNENYVNLVESSFINNNWTDFEYLQLVDDVLTNGELKITRATINGENISAYSVFGRQARFFLEDGFPILTTKKVSFNNIAHELIWFLSGDSNIKYLQDNGVKIWDAWADNDGELGYGTYGTLWRSFPTNDIKGFNLPKGEIEFRVIDQIADLIKNIEKVKQDPAASCGRRLIVTAWHPDYIDSVGLPPCHCLFQFNVTDDKLSCHLYQRSCDLFLGVPYNITSYSLLTYIIAYMTGLKPFEFIHTYSDLHIYENHVEQLKEQLTRQPYELPKLEIYMPEINIDKVKREDLRLVGYKSHPSLKGEVAV